MSCQHCWCQGLRCSAPNPISWESGEEETIGSSCYTCLANSSWGPRCLCHSWSRSASFWAAKPISPAMGAGQAERASVAVGCACLLEAVEFPKQTAVGRSALPPLPPLVDVGPVESRGEPRSVGKGNADSADERNARLVGERDGGFGGVAEVSTVGQVPRLLTERQMRPGAEATATDHDVDVAVAGGSGVVDADNGEVRAGIGVGAVAEAAPGNENMARQRNVDDCKAAWPRAKAAIVGNPAAEHTGPCIRAVVALAGAVVAAPTKYKTSVASDLC